MTRWRVTCDGCDAAFESGAGADGTVAAWCEACQSQAPPGAPACADCGGPLTRGAPAFESIPGELQNLVAVLAAWSGDAAPLARILPERPRWLTDLTPPAAVTAPDPATAAVLERLAAGAFTEVAALALPDTGPGASPLAMTARAIAHERVHDLLGAERDWDRVLAVCEDERARLARGALRARRGDWPAARADLARAGEGFEARWNRAALAVAEATCPGAETPPPDEVLAWARAEAGPPSDYWSDPTVGRLLWTLLLERALGRPGGPTQGDRDALRSAAGKLEFATFWDRALRLHGWARLGMRKETALEAKALTRTVWSGLIRLPALRGNAGIPIARALIEGVQGVAFRDVPGAVADVRVIAARDDLTRYRFPCGRCGLGTLGVESVAEPEEAPAD